MLILPPFNGKFPSAWNSLSFKIEPILLKVQLQVSSLIFQVCFSRDRQQSFCFFYNGDDKQYKQHQDTNSVGVNSEGVAKFINFFYFFPCVFVQSKFYVHLQVTGSWIDVVSTCKARSLLPKILFYVCNSATYWARWIMIRLAIKDLGFFFLLFLVSSYWW